MLLIGALYTVLVVYAVVRVLSDFKFLCNFPSVNWIMIPRPLLVTLIPGLAAFNTVWRTLKDPCILITTSYLNIWLIERNNNNANNCYRKKKLLWKNYPSFPGTLFQWNIEREWEVRGRKEGRILSMKFLF